MKKTLQAEIITRFMDEKTFESFMEDYDKHLLIRRNSNYEPGRHTISFVNRYLDGELSITQLASGLEISLSQAYTTVARTSRWLKLNKGESL